VNELRNEAFKTMLLCELKEFFDPLIEKKEKEVAEQKKKEANEKRKATLAKKKGVDDAMLKVK
jgi:hypothetical protein